MIKAVREYHMRVTQIQQKWLQSFETTTLNHKARQFWKAKENFTFSQTF